MPAMLTIRDQTSSGSTINEITLDFLDEEITVRELIERRVYEEVQDYNTSKPPHFRGLVQPTGAEVTLNGYQLKKPREIDWREQRDRAIEAFQRNGFFILVDDRQATSLDERIRLRLGTEVTFVKLVPLVGG